MKRWISPQVIGPIAAAVIGVLGQIGVAEIQSHSVREAIHNTNQAAQQTVVDCGDTVINLHGGSGR